MPTSTHFVDPEALRAHGIAEGEYVALVFSGPLASIGDIFGMATWNTPRKYAIPDLRVRAADDLARCDAAPLPAWPHPVRPTPGVCFVLADDAHPARQTLVDADGKEFDDFVTLNALTASRMREHRAQRFLASAEGRPIALLGFGDQGRKFLAALEQLRVPLRDVLVADSDPSRRDEARSVGAVATELTDDRLYERALISTPLQRPPAFDQIVAQAKANKRPVLDNGLSVSGCAEFVARGEGTVLCTAGAHRVLDVQHTNVRLRDRAPYVALRLIRQDIRRFGKHRVHHLNGVHRASLSPGADLDCAAPFATDHLPGNWESTARTFVGIDGQSNHHDGAFGLFAARTMLSEHAPEAIQSALPSTRRAIMGATPIETHLAKSMTGRVLAAPYLSSIEQVTLSLLACIHASDAPIIEIGSALGGSAVLMGIATQRGSPGIGTTIYSIDSDPLTRPTMRLAVQHAALESRVRMLEQTSDAALSEVASAVKPLGGAGVIFIDGLHTYEQCLADAAHYIPLLRPGGVVIFHDFDLRHAGVIRAVLEGPARDPSLRWVSIMDTMAVFERIGP